MLDIKQPLSPAYATQEAQAVADLLALGVTLGPPVHLTTRQRQGGHTMCAYHLVVTATGEDMDGGAASTLLDYLTDGTYGGQPGDYTLHPVAGRSVQ